MLDIIEKYNKIEECEIDNDSYLYLFYNHDTKLYKVGITNYDPDKRLCKIQNESGCNLTLIMYYLGAAQIDTCAAHIEEYIHNYFKEKRKKGEWFDFTNRDLIAIRVLIWHILGDDIFDELKEHLAYKLNNLQK
jgi:hypothetical protein